MWAESEIYAIEMFHHGFLTLKQILRISNRSPPPFTNIVVFVVVILLRGLRSLRPCQLVIHSSYYLGKKMTP